MKELDDEHRAIIDAGTRWANNILVELLGNYSGRRGMTEAKAKCLREAIGALSEFSRLRWEP